VSGGLRKENPEKDQAPWWEKKASINATFQRRHTAGRGDESQLGDGGGLVRIRRGKGTYHREANALAMQGKAPREKKTKSSARYRQVTGIWGWGGGRLKGKNWHGVVNWQKKTFSVRPVRREDSASNPGKEGSAAVGRCSGENSAIGGA